MLEKLHWIPHTGNWRYYAKPDFEGWSLVIQCSLCRCLHRHVSADTVWISANSP
ncbi:hypothetical protein Syncc8109_2473 [Synechococcus sp. WH 8109]|nr:hypothetical protein Syncc8109_2473 [Synechococcus sp. WH 8109]